MKKTLLITEDTTSLENLNYQYKKMSDSMNHITFVLNSLAHGGAERVTINLAERLSDKGYNVSIITLNKAKKEYNLGSSIERICLNEYRGKINKVFKLRNSLKSSSTDIILVMGVPLLIYFFPAITGLGIPYVVSERNDPSNFDGKKFTKYISRFFLHFYDGVAFLDKTGSIFYSKRTEIRSPSIINP